MKRKLLSLLVLLMTAATGAWAETVTWNSTNVFNQSHEMVVLDSWSTTPLTYEGITISFSGTGTASGFYPYFPGYDPETFIAKLECFGGNGDSFTFTAPSGKVFTKIEIIDNYFINFTAYGDWTKPENNKIVWSGTPASAVTLGGSNSTFAHDLNSIVFTLATVVASGDCGTGVTWTLTSDGVLIISGTGAMADYASDRDQPWFSNRASITSVVVGSGVTHIGNYSFSQLSNMTSVTFAEGTSPMTIGYSAFNNANLTSITIPNRVTRIDDNAFDGCNNLASVSIPASVTSIGQTAFLHSGIYATALTVTFAEGTSPMTIGPGAFAESNLTSITIPNRVTSIGEYAFLGCGNLATITLNSNPTIGTGAFGSAAVTMNLTANGPVDGAYWMTFYNQNYGFEADGSTTIYKAKVNDGKTAVVLTEVADIPAGNAAVLKSSNAAITMTLTTSASGDYSGNELLGTDVALDNPGNAYCLSNETTGSARGVGFYSYTSTDGPNGDGVIPAHRAYLQIPSSARSFYGFGNDNYTTDIDLPKAVVIEDDGLIYDLSGRRVTGQPKKGIYVKNGKKVVIK